MRIALCGGIASGKSSVADILRGCGAIVLSADEISSEITSTSEYVDWLVSSCGEEFVSDGMPDKAVIRDKIACDDDFRKKINGYLHPKICAEINRRALGYESAGKAVFAEVPLLMTAGMQKDFDLIWYVRADEDKRTSRLIKRSNLSEATARKLIGAQSLEKEAEKIADVIIDNDNTYNILCQIVLREYNALIK